jgi:DNA-binding CsgD family transcriptional regulator
MASGREIEYCALTLHRLWARGDSYQEIAAALGCSQTFISTLKDRHKLPNR